MKKQFEALVIFFAVISASAGCMRAISKELRAQVNEKIILRQVMEDHNAFQGEMVLWGGVIVEAKNLKEGTLLEIVQKPLNAEDRPKNVDQSEGRFLALCEGYLDVAIYSEGREVTVAGRLKGIEKKPLGEIEYAYPYILVEEVYLWPPRKEKEIFYPYWHSPCWDRHPHRLDHWYY